MHPVRDVSDATGPPCATTGAPSDAAAWPDRSTQSTPTPLLQLAAEPSPALESGVRTLLFDEDALKLRFVERILRSRGHFVTACTCVETALLTYRDGDYPLVVLGGPFARAVSLCRRLRTSTARPSVLVVIGWRDQPGDLKTALAGGADEYLPQPVDVVLFNTRIASVERRVEALADREPHAHGAGGISSPQERELRTPDEGASEEVASEQEHDMKPDTFDQTLQHESTARREAEGALVTIRGEMERRISQHLVERRTLVETLHLETEARKDAEAALRDARMELNHRLDQHFTALAALGNAAHVEATARREAEIALREVRAELQRRIDGHTTELRMLAERVQQEAAARKEAEAALRHARGNVRRRADAHRAEMRALRGDLEREAEARQKAEAALRSGPSEPELRIEALDAEVRALAERLEHETAGRKQAETTVRDARAELERCVEAHAQERRALADALERESARREESEHALQIKHAAEVGELAARVRTLGAALDEESARRERAEATLESSRVAVHASGDHLLGVVRRHLRVVTNAAATVASTAGQRAFVTALTKATEASLPTADGGCAPDTQGEPHSGPVDFRFRDTVHDTLEPLTERARRQGLELMWQVAPQVPDVVTGWPDRLRQVLVNLADNAIACTREGEVTVRIDAASWTPGRAVLLVTVADSGVGIAPEQQERMFDVLARADEVLALPATDGGIGLAVSAHLVKSMGGRIWFESEKDTGTTFYFTAPLTARDTTSCAASAATNGTQRRAAGTMSGDRTRPCVLLADDTPEDQERAARLLEGQGYRVVAVRDGREALAALEEEPIDLALTDLRMPRMDGFELAAAIRTAEWAGATAGTGVPIVALAFASAVVAERKRCTAVGIDGYITKPIQAGDLLTAVERALSQR